MGSVKHIPVDPCVALRPGRTSFDFVSREAYTTKSAARESNARYGPTTSIERLPAIDFVELRSTLSARTAYTTKGRLLDGVIAFACLRLVVLVGELDFELAIGSVLGFVGRCVADHVLAAH